MNEQASSLRSLSSNSRLKARRNLASKMSSRPLFTRALVCGFSLLLASSTLSGCAHQAKSPQATWSELRKESSQSDKNDEVALWLLAETLRPGGQAKSAIRARKHLESLSESGVLADLARGIDDVNHGRARAALAHFFHALVQARTWQDPRAPLFAWFAATRADELAGLDPKFGATHKKDVALLLKDPQNIGFRAYATVVDLWAENAFIEGKEHIDVHLADKLGCAKNISLAGPFGTNAASDILRPFAAEQAGVWPSKFEKDPHQPSSPQQLKTSRVGCDVQGNESTFSGIFYGQTYIELDEPQELILAAAGSTHLWVNDLLVLHRDVRIWGIWPRFGVSIQLPAGRHRVLWKFGDPSTALRIMTPDGSPAQVRTSTDAQAGYDLRPPFVGDDPNDLMRYIHPEGVNDPKDDLTRYVAAYLAHEEGQADVAAVLFEPFVKDATIATGTTLSRAAVFVQDDPIYDKSQTRDLVHELELRAATRDPGLWYPPFRNIVWTAEQKGPTTIIEDLKTLAQRFPEVSILHFTLAQLYANLEWGPEHEAKVLDLIKRFPHNENAIKLAIDLYEGEGNFRQVDLLLARLRKVDPDNELFVARALNQKNYSLALQELKSLKAQRPSRKDIAPRIEKIQERSSSKELSIESLLKALKREPRDVHARLALADARLAKGEKNPLPAALANAVEAGADPSIIESAIDLMEGLTALAPYRVDGKKVIEEYEARGEHLPGTAARVLDYGALWVRSDGSSRFLEHEIVRIQSEEAIKNFTETGTNGFVLHLRVLKQDGRILEPESVAGKPTLTMPHLEIGDYVETERILSQWGDGIGDQYSGPGWFFREPNVAYNRSEFIVISPLSKKIVLEPHNGAPEPTITKTGSVIIHHYRVDKSPAAPVEPNSAPAREFLPRIAIGWGLDFNARVRRLSRDFISLTPNDPRLVRIAKKITKDQRSESAKLKALYHWVLDNVQDGKELDGRRVVISRNGNRWRGFQTLCQAANISASWALAESRLAPPAQGPIESAGRTLRPLLVVGEKKHRTWLTIDDKFAPFGTVPSHLRGEKAYVLGSLEAEVTQVPTLGTQDGIRYEGRGVLDKKGTLSLNLRIIFSGSYAASLRNGLAQIPETQLSNIIESRLLGQHLQGARLEEYKILHQENLDKNLVISVKTQVPQFATPSEVGLLLSPPFMPHLSSLTTLSQRATPLLIANERSQGIELTITLPEGMKAQVFQTSGVAKHSSFNVSDYAEGNVLHLVRDVVTQAGRVSVSEYPDLQKYTTSADAALSQAIRLIK